MPASDDGIVYDWNVEGGLPLDDHVAAPDEMDQRRSTIVTLAWPPPSHIVCRP